MRRLVATSIRPGWTTWLFMVITSLVLSLVYVGASADKLNPSTPQDSGSATASAAHFTSAAGSALPFQVSSSSSAVLETITLRGLGNEVLREYQVDNGDELNRWKWTKDYVYAGSKLLASESPGGIRHYHVDHLGTTRVITDAAGTSLSATPYEYFPFGDEATPEPPNDERFRFTGHERDINDPLKPDYMHARYYYRGGSAGKFLSVDPAKDWDPKRPQGWNLYSYVRNNPIKLVDPTGKTAILRSNVPETLAAIRDTVPPDLRDDIQLTPTIVKGVFTIDRAVMAKVPRTQSENFEDLRAIVNDNKFYVIGISSSHQHDAATRFKLEASGLRGATSLPQHTGKNVRVTVSIDLTTSERVYTMSHELYGHAGLWLRGKNYQHGTTTANMQLYDRIQRGKREIERYGLPPSNSTSIEW